MIGLTYILFLLLALFLFIEAFRFSDIIFLIVSGLLLLLIGMDTIAVGVTLPSGYNATNYTWGVENLITYASVSDPYTNILGLLLLCLGVYAIVHALIWRGERD
jgi:small neutral amino acid transporter SnatA (MarC family)